MTDRIERARERVVGKEYEMWIIDRFIAALAEEGLCIVPANAAAARISQLEAIVRRIASDDVRDRRGIIPDAKALIGLSHSEKNSASEPVSSETPPADRVWRETL